MPFLTTSDYRYRSGGHPRDSHNANSNASARERGRADFSIKQVCSLLNADAVQPRIGINDTSADSLPLVGCILRDLCVKLRRTAYMQNSKPPLPPPSSTSRAAGPTGFYLYTLSARDLANGRTRLQHAFRHANSNLPPRATRTSINSLRFSSNWKYNISLFIYCALT